MSNLVALPVVLPILIGVFLIFFQKRVYVQRFIAGFGILTNLVGIIYLIFRVKNEGVIILQAGGWQAPYGIILVADMFAALMLLSANLVAAACIFYSFGSIGREREKYYYYPFVFFMMTGVSGAFLTGDIFNLFVFFEVMLISSYALIVLGGTRIQLRESIKYLVVNVFSSTLFVAALGLLYSVLGTLNMADLAVKVREVEQAGILNAVAIMFFIVFAMKAALFPLYFWLPGAYSAPPAPIAALFGGLLTKVGVYSIVRIFTMIFAYNQGFTQALFLIIAGLTMLLGVIGAVGSNDVRKILAYNIISGVGFMIMGLGIFTGVSLAGTVYYMMHDMIIKAALFLLIGVLIKVAGTSNLSEMSGVIKVKPVLGWVFLVAAVALAGVPPLGGFIGKFLLVKGGLMAGNYLIIGASLVTSLLILFSIMKIFLNGFWGEVEINLKRERTSTRGLMVPATSLVVVSLLLGLGAGFVYPYIEIAAHQLSEPAQYISSVLKE